MIPPYAEYLAVLCTAIAVAALWTAKPRRKPKIWWDR